MAGLRHPAVVQFFGVSLDPPMLVTEYCERGSLFNVVYNMRFSAPETVSSGFDWRRRLSLALDAALGMEFLVRHCVVPAACLTPNENKNIHMKTTTHPGKYKTPNRIQNTCWNCQIHEIEYKVLVSSLCAPHSPRVSCTCCHPSSHAQPPALKGHRAQRPQVPQPACRPLLARQGCRLWPVQAPRHVQEPKQPRGHEP